MIPMLVNTYEIAKNVKGHVAHFRNIAFVNMQRIQEWVWHLNISLEETNSHGYMDKFSQTDGEVL